LCSTCKHVLIGPYRKGQCPKWWERVSSLRAKSPYYHQCASL
jgi:hypothetical protein